MLKRMMYRPIDDQINSTIKTTSRSERPLILLVVPIASVQAPRYLLAHRGIGGDREVFRSERQASIGPVPAFQGSGHAFKKLNSI